LNDALSHLRTIKEIAVKILTNPHIDKEVLRDTERPRPILLQLQQKVLQWIRSFDIMDNSVQPPANALEEQGISTSAVAQLTAAEKVAVKHSVLTNISEQLKIMATGLQTASETVSYSTASS